MWDGNNYQFLSRATLLTGGAGLLLSVARLDELVVISAFFLLIGIGMVPKGPQPPTN